MSKLKNRESLEEDQPVAPVELGTEGNNTAMPGAQDDIEAVRVTTDQVALMLINGLAGLDGQSQEQRVAYVSGVIQGLTDQAVMMTMHSVNQQLEAFEDSVQLKYSQAYETVYNQARDRLNIIEKVFGAALTFSDAADEKDRRKAESHLAKVIRMYRHVAAVPTGATPEVAAASAIPAWPSPK